MLRSYEPKTLFHAQSLIYAYNIIFETHAEPIFIKVNAEKCVYKVHLLVFMRQTLVDDVAFTAASYWLV
jgi:hypothetical protein